MIKKGHFLIKFDQNDQNLKNNFLKVIKGKWSIFLYFSQKYTLTLFSGKSPN